MFYFCFVILSSKNLDINFENQILRKNNQYGLFTVGNSDLKTFQDQKLTLILPNLIFLGLHR